MIHLVEMLFHKKQMLFQTKMSQCEYRERGGNFRQIPRTKETNAHLTNRLTLYHSHLSSLDLYFLFHMKIYEFHMKKYHPSKYREEKDNSRM